MSDTINMGKLHAYMLKKTQEYYHCPPSVLVDDVIMRQKENGNTLTYEQAKKLVTPIEIQRLIKKEMHEKWPELMAQIPSNPLPPDKR